MLKSGSRKFWNGPSRKFSKLGVGSRKIWKGRSWSRIFYLQPHNPGVLQGSVFGLLLFLVYADDIVNCTESLSCLFANDTALLFSSNCPFHLHQVLSRDLCTSLVGVKSMKAGFLKCFRDPIRVSRIENWILRIRENYQRVPRIREIGVSTGPYWVLNHPP